MWLLGFSGELLGSC